MLLINIICKQPKILLLILLKTFLGDIIYPFGSFLLYRSDSSICTQATPYIHNLKTIPPKPPNHSFSLISWEIIKVKLPTLILYIPHDNLFFQKKTAMIQINYNCCLYTFSGFIFLAIASGTNTISFNPSKVLLRR